MLATAMKSRLVGAIFISALTVGMSARADAQQAPLADPGKHEYETSCAVCHGLSGKGDGPFSNYMEKSRVPDLTTIAKQNNGVFPFARVYGTIDGTNLVGAHGTRDMPIWGDRYKIEALKQEIYEPRPQNPEVFTRARILALTEYIYRLQAQ